MPEISTSMALYNSAIAFLQQTLVIVILVLAGLPLEAPATMHTIWLMPSVSQNFLRHVFFLFCQEYLKWLLNLYVTEIRLGGDDDET